MRVACLLEQRLRAMREPLRMEFLDAMIFEEVSNNAKPFWVSQ
jgi:hypothetical protein